MPRSNASIALSQEYRGGLTAASETSDPPALPDLAKAVKPFMKWAGGKTRLLPRLLPFVPGRIRDYHEPFVGGGAMFFALRPQITGTSFLADLNPELVNAWLAVRDSADELREYFAHYKALDGEDFYYSMRPLQPESDVERAARFIYLNQTSWNGLWRVNKWGGFNVPWGRRAFRGIDDSFFATLNWALEGVVVEPLDFRETLLRPKRGDFVYLDPPYLPLSDTSKFHLYTERRFREPDLRQLAGLCHDLTDRGVNWLLSNRDTPLVRELFADATIIGLTTRRSVAAQNRRDVEKVNSPEVIVVGGDR